MTQQMNPAGVFGGYGAVVYVDGTAIFARDKSGRLIYKGVAGTNDVAAIQAAIDFIDDNNTGGKVVLTKNPNAGTYEFPGEWTVRVDYVVDSTIYVPKTASTAGISLIGDAVYLKATSCDAKVLHINQSSEHYYSYGGKCEVSGISIAGLEANTNTIGIFVDETGRTGTEIRNCLTHNCYKGIVFNGESYGSVIDTCKIMDGAYGIHFLTGTGSYGPNGCFINNCDIEGTSINGIWIQQGWGCAISNLYMEANAVSINNDDYRTQMSNLYIQETSGACIQTVGGRISNSMFEATTGKCIEHDATDWGSPQVNNCYFYVSGAGYGFYNSGSAVATAQTSISKNHFYLGNAAANGIYGKFLHCNFGGNCFTGDGNGIYAYDGDRITINGNDFYYCPIGIRSGSATRMSIVGNTFEGCTTDLALNSTTGHVVSENPGLTTVTGGGGASFRNNPSYVRDKWGVTASVADGGTITHGLNTTPTGITITPSVSGEFVSATTLGATTVTVAIKKHDNSTGTTQTLYWHAWV